LEMTRTGVLVSLSYRGTSKELIVDRPCALEVKHAHRRHPLGIEPHPARTEKDSLRHTDNC
jgi:hypothetical protein